MGPPHPRGAWQDALVSWGKISTVSAACAESFLCQGPGLEMPWVLGKGWGGGLRCPGPQAKVVMLCCTGSVGCTGGCWTAPLLALLDDPHCHGMGTGPGRRLPALALAEHISTVVPDSRSLPAQDALKCWATLPVCMTNKLPCSLSLESALLLKWRCVLPQAVLVWLYEMCFHPGWQRC